MKKTIIGLVVGMLIGSAGMAAAATTQSVQAALAKFTISIDGQKQTLKNDPLIYKGTTYLPVREVAEMTGYALDYDNTKKSIDLKSKGGTSVTTQTDINLNDWVMARKINNEYGVIIEIGTLETKVTYGDKSITFPLTTTSGVGTSSASPIIYQSADKSCSIMVLDSSIYFGKNTLTALGITQ